MKDRLLVMVLALATVLSVGYTYYQTVVLQSFEVMPLEEEVELIEDDVVDTSTE